MRRATLRLFNAIQVQDKAARHNAPLERMVRNGYLLDQAIPARADILNDVEEIVGLSGEKMNASFHKSWKVIRDTPMEILVIQQILHYITTYGFERLGIFDNDTVYIPKEGLQIPGVSFDIPLVVVRALTAEEILDKIVELGSSGVALMKETLDDIMVLVVENHYDSEFVHGIKNRELKARLFEHYGLVPTNPEEYLRYVITKLTGDSLVIKNKALVEKLKAADRKKLDALLEKAPANLASIFLRYKPLFLAMKHASGNKRFFNKLRKDAERLHVPMPEDYLNTVTAKVKDRTLDPDKLARKLGDANIFRKVRLANALLYRLQSTDAIVYRVRNGRGYATAFNWPASASMRTREALEVAYESIIADLKEKVDGKTIYIPDWMHYSIPATEKMFTGHFPTGSSVEISGDTIVGIHWTDTNKRVDLDLSLMDHDGKLGWDAGYRSGDLRTLFSGDITSAPEPDGAAELFYFNGRVQTPKLILVNYFNFSAGDEVECALLVAQEKVTHFSQNYMVDPNNVIARSRMTLSKKQNVIGLIASVNGKNRVFFANTSVGNSITASLNKQSMQTRSYLVNNMTGNLDLREMLAFAGAEIITERPEDEEVEYLDLAPDALDKTTILGLIS